MEVLAGRQPGGLEDRPDDLVGGARVGRRLQDDQRAGVQVPRDRLRRLLHGRQVGAAVVRQRRGHADHDRARAVEDRLVARGREARREHLLDLGRADVVDVREPGLQPRDDLRVAVQAGDAQPGAAGLPCAAGGRRSRVR